MLNVIRDEGITILFAFPALLRSLVSASAEPAGATLRLVRIGGDTTLWSDIDSLRGWLAPGADIQLIYAATEAPMLQWFVADSCRGDDARVPIGYPLAGNRHAIVDGELIVASPYVSLSHTDRVFRTGDLVRQRPDGLLERLGRKDRQVKIRGARVHLEGVEALLRKHPSVRDVAALARTTNGTTTLVAYVSPRDDAPAELIAELRGLMRSAPSPLCPARFDLTRARPRLPSSKLDVRALAALDNSNIESERAIRRPSTERAPTFDDRVAQTVARVWQDVLGTPVLDAHDDFFAAGGDSLKAITFAMKLERILCLELSPTLIYDTPSFSEFCEALRNCRASGYAPLVLLKAGAESPPLFVIHGVGGNVLDLLPMARGMAYSGPVIGIRARGLARGETPHSSVQAMAADYLREIKARQPNGPYCLCGYTFGGLVAFEIARQLADAGDEISFVGLFDTMMSPLRSPLRAWLSLIGLRKVRMPGDVRVLRVTATALFASARYRPGFYSGQLTLFTPAGREPGLPSPEAIWRKHARTLRIIETTGDHTSMLSAAHADTTAASVTRCLCARADVFRPGAPHFSS
jgi:thioesterase domain-containing protein